MKKLLSVILCLCLLACAAAFAEEADEVSELSFLLKIRDQSGLNLSYLRFDTYDISEGAEEYTGFVLSCPDEGEDFYRFPISVSDPESLKSTRFDLSYGVSEQNPGDAILSVMTGNTEEEHPLLTLDFIPECGKVYDLILAAGAEGAWTLTSDAGAASEGFRYLHDPSENPSAMADIIVNPDAVYGFSPDPESTRLGEYAAYDWTDPDLVAQAKENRIAYHESLYTMYDILYEMRDAGASVEEMARAVSAERNRLRLAVLEDNPEALATTKKSNLETYGNEEGPTADSLYEKYGSWETVLQKAFSPNAGMDAVCGLYDDYYPLYVELGMIGK